MDEFKVLSLVESLPIESRSKALSTSSNPKKTRVKTATKIQQYVRMAKVGELERKGRLKVLYCIHYTIDPPYSSYIITNFRAYLVKAYQITIQEDKSSLQSKVTTEFNSLYQKASALGRIIEIQNEVFQKYL